QPVGQRRPPVRTGAAAALLLVRQTGVVERGVVRRPDGVLVGRAEGGLLVGVGAHRHLVLGGTEFLRLLAAHALLLSWAPVPAPTSSRSAASVARGTAERRVRPSRISSLRRSK